MLILKKEIKVQEKIKNSRFIAELFPCENAKHAREILKSQKQKYKEATHVVHAFVCGLKGEVMGQSDDGEPEGTSGRPALEVLKGRKVTNLILTVTRYFGGALLGRGGLVKAYSSLAARALEEAALQGALEEYVERRTVSLSLPYSALSVCERLFERLHVAVMERDFTERVDLTLLIEGEKISILEKELGEILAQKLILK